MDTPIDKLVFALGGDTAPLTDAFKQAESAAAKTGKTIQQNLGAGFKDAAGQVQSDATAIKNTMSGVESHVANVSSHIQVSRREMIYAFREIANGDIQRLPATMALLLSHMLELSPVAIIAGASIAAIPVAIAASMLKADEALAKLRTSIALTGNASGVSISQAADSAVAAAQASHGALSSLGAQRVMGGLVGAGVPRSLLQQATLAAGNYSLGSGASQEDSTNMLARALMEPAKGAVELNRTMHLLTAEQTEYVKDLDESGQQEKAAAIILKEFSERTKEAAAAASVWSKTVSSVGNYFGQIGHGIALDMGAGPKLEKLNAQDFAYFASHGATGMAQYRAGAHMPGYEQRYAAIKPEIDAQAADAKKKGDFATAQDAVGKGLEDAKTGADAFNHKLHEMQMGLDRDTYALNQANSGHATFSKDTIDRLSKQHDAMKQAVEMTDKYGHPGMAEQRQLAYARQLAGTPLEKQGIVGARQQAQEQHIRELMNPQTTLQADANFKINAAKASLNLGDINRSTEQDRRVQTMKEEADGAKKTADAYMVSRDAMERARIEAEIGIEVTNKRIKASAQDVAIQYKLSTAIDEVRKQIGKQLETAGIENDATKIELAAGGNPLAVMHAAASAGAYKTTQQGMDMAKGDPVRLAQLASQRAQMTDKDYQRAQMDAQKSAQGTLFGAQTDLAGKQRLYAAQTSGMSDDDLRRFQVWNQLVQEFTRQGLDPADAANQKLFQDTLKTNTALSDLGDEMQKTAQEAKGLADSITGGLANWIRNPTMNWKDALANIGQDMLSTVVQTNILDPMNKFLTSQFSDVIGGGALGSSPLNPMYVTSAGGLGGFGGGGGGLFGSGSSAGGGLFGGLGDLFGGGGGSAGNWAGSIMDDGSVIGGAAGAAGGGGFLSGIMSFLGLLALAGGGPTQGGKSYLVGEDGPELWTEGASGYMTPAPMVQSAMNGRSRGQGGGGDTNNMHFHLPNVTDTKSFIKSRSQVENAYYKMAARGKRNA